MKKLIFFSLFVVILFSCKKKDDVKPTPPAVKTYPLTVTVNDTGSIIQTNKKYDVGVFYTAEDMSKGINEKMYGYTDANGQITFNSITNTTVFIYVRNADNTEATTSAVDNYQNKNFTIYLDN